MTNESYETKDEAIDRLLKSNNRLAQMVKAGSDRLAESARELMAQGWDAGYDDCWDFHQSAGQIGKDTNPYRQPIELPGATK